jgi:hypothetical protein
VCAIQKKIFLPILTSIVFSKLYYNVEVWHLPYLNHSLLQKLMAFSANSITMALHYPRKLISYENLHKMWNKATPEIVCIYKLSLLLNKLYNYKFNIEEWTHFNFEHILTTRPSQFEITQHNHNFMAGKNVITNKLQSLNGKIPLFCSNKTFLQFKLECKKKFLSF